MSLPHNIAENDKVILFDGMCKLCNGWSNFIIAKDQKQHFKLCSVQSDEGRAILEYFEFPTDFFETMLYVEGNQCYQKSDAYFRIMGLLAYPWKSVCVFRILPRIIRDWMYDRIALNRYSLFGKYDQCRLPTADHEKRFLSAN